MAVIDSNGNELGDGDAVQVIKDAIECGQGRNTVVLKLSRLRRSLWICAVLALSMPATDALAQIYSVNVNRTLDGLDIGVEPVAQSGLLVVKLTNKTEQKVRCDLRYDAAPQPLYRKTTYVDAGKTEQSVFRAKRKWLSVDVAVECKLAAQ